MLLLLAGAAITGGAVYWWAGSNLQAAVAALDVRLSASGSQSWRNLMEANPGNLIDRERGPCSAQNGGVACQFSLWTTPAAPKPE